MPISWKDIAFQMEPSVALASAEAWSWLVAEPWNPVLCSKLGAAFLEKSDGTVHWLDTGTGLVEEVATSVSQFEEMVRTSPDLVDEWFLPPVIERLHAAGKIAGSGECYGFVILPVFDGGKYEVGNMFVVPVAEQFVGMADVHRQLSQVPDGATVQIKLVD